MPKPKTKPLTPSEMARKRWEGVSAAERSRLAKAAIAVRWSKRPKPKKTGS